MTKKLYDATVHQFVRDNFKTMQVEKIAAKLGISDKSVKGLIVTMGLRNYTEKELQYIRDNYQTMNYSEIGKHLGRSNMSVKGTALRKLKLKRTPENISKMKASHIHPMTMSKEKMEIIGQHFGKMPDRHLAKLVGCAPPTVRRVAVRIGITDRLSDKPKPPSLTAEQMDYVKTKFGKRSNRIIADKLGCSHVTVARAARKLRLEPPKKNFALWKMEDGAKTNKKRTHLRKWEKSNGNVGPNHVLVYRTAAYENFDDIRKIRKSSYHDFVLKRDVKRNMANEKRIKNLQTELANKKRREEKKLQTQIKKEGGVVRYTMVTSRRKQRSEDAKKLEEYKKNYVYRNLEQSSEVEQQAGKVPVRLDEKTVVFVDRNKCILIDGRWVKDPKLITPHVPRKTRTEPELTVSVGDKTSKNPELIA